MAVEKRVSPGAKVEPWLGAQLLHLVLTIPSPAIHIAVLPRVRTGCRGGTPSWGRSPHTPYVLSSMRNAIKGFFKQVFSGKKIPHRLIGEEQSS